MDVNLTYAVPLNISMNQPSQTWLTNPAIIALFGVIIGAVIASWSSFAVEKYKSKESKKNNKILAYSNLLGCKRTLSQYYTSYIISVINAEHLILYARLMAIKHIDFTPIGTLLNQGKTEEANQIVNENLRSILEKSQDQKEGLRAREREDTLSIQVGVTSEKFWGIIGQIKTLFPDTNVIGLVEDIRETENGLGKLDKDIVDTFKKIHNEMKNESGSIISNEKRDSWVNSKRDKLEETADSAVYNLTTKEHNLELKIDTLLSYLENSLK